MTPDPGRFSEPEALDFLLRLFPDGLKSPALVAEMCPEGWENSPLREAFHPSPQRAYEEYRRVSVRLARLSSPPARRSSHPDRLEPVMSFDEFLANRARRPAPPAWLDPADEPSELLGLCLWDIFSDNHDVIAADKRIVHLGSFRGSGGMIADFMDDHPPTGDPWREGDYLRFHMGSRFVGDRADLSPVYQLIFRRLRALGADWRYALPRTHLISIEKPADTPPDDYKPSESLRHEEEGRKRREETRRKRAALAHDTKAAKRRARSGEPPPTVRAYQAIYDRHPQGWPPDPCTAD